MLCISAAYAVMRCLCLSLCVCVCVCHVRELCQNEQTYLQNFFTIGSQAILDFLCQTARQYSDGNCRKGGVGPSDAGGVGRIAILSQYLTSRPAVNAATAARCCQHAADKP